MTDQPQPSERCERCSRPGELVAQFRCEASRFNGMPGPWVFRYRLCRYHRASDNRLRPRGWKRWQVLEWKPDEQVLQEAAKR